MGEPMIPLGTLMVSGLDLEPIGRISRTDENAAWLADIRLSRTMYTDDIYCDEKRNVYYIANSSAYMKRAADIFAERELKRVCAVRDAVLNDLVIAQGRSSTVIGDALYCIAYNGAILGEVRIARINQVSGIISKTLEQMHQQINAIAHKDQKRCE